MCDQSYVERFCFYFGGLGSMTFARSMAQQPFYDEVFAENLALSLDDKEVLSALSFHGNIGDAPKHLDAHATEEQRAAIEEGQQAVLAELVELGKTYEQKHGIKFLVSAKGKTGTEMLSILKDRLKNSREQEWATARCILWEIARKRFGPSQAASFDELKVVMKDGVKTKNAAVSVAVCTSDDSPIQTVCQGSCDSKTLFEVASLSKSVGTAFAIEYFNRNNIPLDKPVNKFLEALGSSFRVQAAPGCPPEWAEQVLINHLMRHAGLNMHYVKGVPANQRMIPVERYLNGMPELEVDPVMVINEPGGVFKYSGAGFILLQYLIEQHSGTAIAELTRPFLDALDATAFTFEVETLPDRNYACGITDDGEMVEGTRKMFPAFAAGGMSTMAGMLQVLRHLSKAYRNIEGSSAISHDTARLMLQGSNKSMDFMGCKIGHGIFVLEGEDNKCMVHQGANDGFRVLFLHCFAGPDAGKGFSVVTTGDNDAVQVNSRIAQHLLQSLNFSGVDFGHFGSGFKMSNLKQEEIVNVGYKQLVFNAFIPSRAEQIVKKKGAALNPLLSSPNNVLLGAEVRSCTNDMFARVENLISPHEPVFDPELFGKQGKIMDSWESPRHNELAFDEAVLVLAPPGGHKSAVAVRYVYISTMYHTGNHVPEIRLVAQEGNEEGGQKPATWDLLPGVIKMDGHSFRKIDLGEKSRPFSTLRVHIIPDGGLTRLALFGELPSGQEVAATEGFVSFAESRCMRHPETVPAPRKPLSLEYTPTKDEVVANLAKFKSGEEVNVASTALGAVFVSASNEHYGKAVQALSPYPPINMFDGLESARSRTPGSCEEMTFELAWPCKPHRLVAEFTYFVNNCPKDLKIEARTREHGQWMTLVDTHRVKHFAAGKKQYVLNPELLPLIDAMRVKCIPCGGMNRIHVYTTMP